MKRFYFIFVALCAVLLSFCTKDDSFAGDMPSGGEPDETPLSEIRSVDEALGELSDLMDVIDDKQTRSGKYRTIRSVTVSGGAATRGSENPLPDTLVYVVNFDNEEGFAILGAHRALPPVYAITESGTFDASELTSAISQASASTSVDDSQTRAESRSADETFTDAGPGIIRSLIASNIVDTYGFAIDTLHPQKPIYIPEYDSVVVELKYEIAEKYGPYVQTKWNQGRPFDLYCPEIDTRSTGSSEVDVNASHMPVGCTMVALGQILAYHEKPTGLVLYDERFSWRELKSVSNYTNYEQYPFYKKTWTFEENPEVFRLALFLRQLGGKEYCNANYSPTGTGADVDDVQRVLRKSKFGYKNVTITNGYSSDKVADAIVNGELVYIRAFKPNSSGHAWVIDGRVTRNIYEQPYKYRNGQGIGLMIDRKFIGTDVLVHCNFGWQSDCDGYYYEEVFNTAKRVSIEEGFDSGTQDMNCNYATEIKILTYDL